MADYYLCSGAGCSAKVSKSSLYCCAPCADAAEGNYEIDEHSGACVERQADRVAASFDDRPRGDR